MSEPLDTVRIGALSLRVQGVAPAVAQQAVSGLEAELLRRLGARGIDALSLRDLTPVLRVPPLRAQSPLDAATLRAAIVDGLVAALSPDPRAVVAEEED